MPERTSDDRGDTGYRKKKGPGSNHRDLSASSELLQQYSSTEDMFARPPSIGVPSALMPGRTSDGRGDTGYRKRRVPVVTTGTLSASSELLQQDSSTEDMFARSSSIGVPGALMPDHTSDGRGDTGYRKKKGPGSNHRDPSASSALLQQYSSTEDMFARSPSVGVPGVLMPDQAC